MRLQAVLRHTLLSFALLSPAFALAQFQEPTSEELKMTSEPKAPGAAAVYLYREEYRDDTNYYRTINVRIKVLAEKGKELATVTIPMDHYREQVKDFHARTIHADGTVIPLIGKPEDLVTFKSADYQEDSLVFTLPNVEVGSILEYKLRLNSDLHYTVSGAPTWWVEQSYFVRKEHFYYKPQFGVAYNKHLGPNAKFNADWAGFITLDMQDVLPLPEEDWMPPQNTRKQNVDFFYTEKGNNSGKAFWDSAEREWADSVSSYTEPNNDLKLAIAEIISPGDTETQKAEKIYAAVMKLENTDFTRKKSKEELHKAKQKENYQVEFVWKQRSGSGDELALLYVALARTANLKAWPMRVVNRDRALFDANFLSTYQLDDTIVVASLDGKEVVLDPGQKMCPFGALHWKHTLAGGLRMTDKNTAIFSMTHATPYKNSWIQRVADLSVDAAGNVSGTARILLSGPEALYWRQLALKDDEDEVKRQFNEWTNGNLPEGVKGDFDHFLGLDDPSVNLIGVVKVYGGLGSATGKHMILPGLFFQSRVKHPFIAQEKRISPVDVHYARMENDEVTYELPSGYSLEAAPAAVLTSWPDHAVLHIDFSAKDNSVTAKRTLAYNFTLLDAKEYPELHDFYQKVSTADQQQLMLTRVPQAKGN